MQVSSESNLAVCDISSQPPANPSPRSSQPMQQLCTPLYKFNQCHHESLACYFTRSSAVSPLGLYYNAEWVHALYGTHHSRIPRRTLFLIYCPTCRSRTQHCAQASTEKVEPGKLMVVSVGGLPPTTNTHRTSLFVEREARKCDCDGRGSVLPDAKKP